MLAVAPLNSAYVYPDQQSCALLGNIEDNRSIDGISFRQKRTGETVVEVQTTLALGRGQPIGRNLTFDIIVTHNGVLHERIAMEPIVVESAITCAVNCTGDCPYLIFWEGYCGQGKYGCQCIYPRIFVTPFEDGELRPGDTVSATIVPTRGGLAEVDMGDDSFEVIFQ